LGLQAHKVLPALKVYKAHKAILERLVLRVEQVQQVFKAHKEIPAPRVSQDLLE
jgi:hypothetical protein